MTDTQPHADAQASVAVRMYRGLLGDCFLLTHRHGERRYHALIDCGVLQCIGSDKPATKAGAEHMKKVAASLHADTDGRLDLVVGTHEHYDHLSGFQIAHDVFKTFEIGEVWLAWTENDLDDLAVAIRENGRKAVKALNALVETDGLGLAADDPEAAARVAAIANLMQFQDSRDPEDKQAPKAVDELFGAAPRKKYDPADRPRSCADVIDWLKSRPRTPDRVRYLKPGETVRFGLDGALVAKVLGPPRSKRLLKLDPTDGNGKEVYLADRDVSEALLSTLRLHVAESSGLDAPPVQMSTPFSERFWRTAAEAELVAEQEARGSESVEALYHQDASRRIDAEWLGTAEQLAMKIDGDVNNTSLALAIELPVAERHVLLFPADAQVGNWLSWHDQEYPVTGDPKKTETAEQLLGRVVLYKVGHHGSHNATARKEGLEMMCSPHLAAMIPVVKAVAGEQTSSNNPQGWAMPYDKLYQRLEKVAANRILLGDGVPAEEAPWFEGSLFDLAYADAGGKDPLWVELSLPLA